MAQDITVAKTILEQLGGRRFVALTGARGMLGGSNWFSFKLPSYFAQKGINAVRITLMPSDTYRMEFSRIRGMKITPISVHEDIYCDGLQALFTQQTGLVTTF